MEQELFQGKLLWQHLLSLPVVVSQLNSIASETQAGLEVTDSGQLVYKFDANLDRAYLAQTYTSVTRRLFRIVANITLAVLRILCTTLYFLLRISFGIILILSVVAIIVLIVVAIVAAVQDSEGEGGGLLDAGQLFDFSGDGGRPWFLYWGFDWLWDWFFFSRYCGWRRRYYYSYWDWDDYIPSPSEVLGDSSSWQTRHEEDKKKEDKEKQEKRNFVDAVLSFLFGEGNPNEDLEDRKWQTIGKVIASNQGIVVAEQLAPYTGNSCENEDWMIPILVQFEGSPDVSESGSIIYEFPSFRKNIANSLQPLQTANQDSRVDQADQTDQLRNLVQRHIIHQKVEATAKELRAHLPVWLPEMPFAFTTLDNNRIIQILLYAFFVLIAGFALAHSNLPVLAQFKPLLYGISAYGLLILAIPGVRYFWTNGTNEKISERNEAKMTNLALLNNPTEDLQRKLDEAMVLRHHSLPADQLIFTTEKDSLEQRFQ